MEILFESFVNFLALDIMFGVLMGVTIGVVGGALPGISPSMTIALMLPVTLYVPTPVAIALLMGAYQGSMFGGSIPAILINTPGTASAAATVFDGYPMALKGQAGKALLMTLYASCTGGVIGIILLIALAKPLSTVTLQFGPPEYFGLMLLALTLIAGISGRSLLKGLIAGMIGLFFSTVGMDPIYATKRFTFGNISLADGIQTLSIFIGLFALTELLTQLLKGKEALNQKLDSLKINEKLSFKEYWSQRYTILTGGIVGSIIGILPGVGGSTAPFVAYAEAQRRSKHPELFGTGILDGVAAPESATSAQCGGALVPTLTLGIPGDLVTAVLVGGLIAHGIKPGPLLFTNDIGSVYTIYIALFFSVIFLLIVGRVALPAFSLIVKLRKAVLLPMVFIICVVGMYSIRSNLFDVIMMVAFGAVGFVLKQNGFPIPPMVIAFVLGTPLEISLRQGLLLAGNSPVIFLTRPLSAALIVISVLSAVFMVRRNKKMLAKTKA